MAVKLLAEPREKVSYRQINRILHVGHNTLRSIEVREGIAIAFEKRELRDLAGFGTRVMFEKALELAPTITSAKEAAISGGIFCQNLHLLDGSPTVHIEVTQRSRNIFEEFQAFSDQIEKMVNARVIEAGEAPGNSCDNSPEISSGCDNTGSTSEEPVDIGLDGGKENAKGQSDEGEARTR